MDNKANNTVVLVVEDNERLLRISARMLAGAGHTILTAPTLAAAREHLQAATPDAVVLDILLPDGNGLDFIGEIRAVTSAPVLLVTSLGEKDHRLAGLRAGGDDYIAKPYDIDELVERVAAFLRREAMHREKPVTEIIKGPLRLDIVASQATLNGEGMGLTPKEFLVLHLLARNEGKDISAEALYEEVWGQPMAGDDHSIKNAVYRVRRKLNGSGYSISMTRGRGYQFKRMQ